MNQKLNIELTSRQAESRAVLLHLANMKSPMKILAEALGEWLLRHGAEFGDAAVLKKLGIRE